MKRFPKLIPLLLSVLLVLSLVSGCEKTPSGTPSGTPNGDHGGGTADNQSSVSGPDALDALEDAIDKTRDDLKARFGASDPGKAWELLSSPAFTAEYSAEKTSDDGESKSTVTGTAVQDRDSGTALVTNRYEPEGYGLSLTYSPDFVGVASRELFGSDVFYGVDPKDMSSQLSGTPFSGIFSLDEAGLGGIDGFLSALPEDAGVYGASFLDGAASALKSFLAGKELSADSAEDPRTFTAVLTPAETADLMGRLADLMPEGIMGYGMVSGDDSVLGFRETIEKLRSSASDTPVSFTVSDGRLRHISASAADGAYSLEVELYGDSGSLLSVSLDPVLSFTLDLGDGVDFDMFTSWCYGSTTTLDWANDGKFDYITYSTDITTLALEGTLNVSDSSLSYDGIWFTGERGDRDALTFTVTRGGTVPPPAETKSLADLTEAELEKMILGIYLKIK